MNIESILKRENGTKVVLDRSEYHFKPNPDIAPDGAHVCPVEDERHIDIFLGITEGYRPYESGQEPAQPRIVAPKPIARKESPILSPIELSEHEEAEDRARADAEKAEYLAQVERDAVEAAAAQQLLADAAMDSALRDGDGDEDGIETFEPEDTDEEDPDDAGASEGEEGGDAETGLTNESLEALTESELSDIYEANVGKAPKSNMKRATIIKAIIATQAPA